MTAVTSAAFPATEPRAARLRPSAWLRAALLASLVAVAVTLVFDLTAAEQTVDRAVALEGHDHGAIAVPELFSRGEQRGGLVAGLLLYGAGMAFLLSGAAVLASRATRLRPAVLWLWLVGAAGWSVSVLPALSAPPLPPGLEVDRGIGARQGLYLAAAALGIVAVALGARLSASASPGGRALVVSLALLASALAAVFLFPEQRVLGHVPDAVLRDFRLAAFTGQLLFWSALAGAGYLLLGRDRR
jgi:hypothetical protein